MVRLLISDGSWLVLRVAEKATLALPERTEMPSEEVTAPSADGLESHTTRHLPSSTMGSVSFCARTGQPAGSSSSSRASAARRQEPQPAGSRSAPRRPGMVRGGPRGPRPGARIRAAGGGGARGRRRAAAGGAREGAQGCAGPGGACFGLGPLLCWSRPGSSSEGRRQRTCEGEEPRPLDWEVKLGVGGARGAGACSAKEAPSLSGGHSLSPAQGHPPPRLAQQVGGPPRRAGQGVPGGSPAARAGGAVR